MDLPGWRSASPTWMALLRAHQRYLNLLDAVVVGLHAGLSVPKTLVERFGSCSKTPKAFRACVEFRFCSTQDSGLVGDLIRYVGGAGVACAGVVLSTRSCSWRKSAQVGPRPLGSLSPRRLRCLDVVHDRVVHFVSCFEASCCARCALVGGSTWLSFRAFRRLVQHAGHRVGKNHTVSRECVQGNC